MARTKYELGIRAKGRKFIESGEAFQLQEPEVSYPEGFDNKNDFIGTENPFFWSTNPDISI